MRKICIFLAAAFIFSILGGLLAGFLDETAHAVTKTMQIDIQGCWT